MNTSQKVVQDFSPPVNPARCRAHGGLKSWTTFLLLLTTVPSGSGSVAELQLDISRNPASGAVELRGPEDSHSYYILERSPDLMVFTPDAITPGSPAPLWKRDPQPDAPAMYYRLRSVSRETPLDTDGDGIDDVWELERPLLLNPLDASDAVRDPDGDGLSHLDDYRRAHRGTRGGDGGTLPDDAISREISIFNEGAPTAAVEAISQEVSLYNGETPPLSDIFDAVSREVSVVNLGEATAFIESISAEVSVFNFGSPPVAVEAISLEVSLYNGETPPQSDIFDAVSREISVLNIGEPSAVIESISREVSIFNNLTE